MCYKKNGPRCTPQARAKLARAKQRVADYAAAHPNAKFNEDAPKGSIDAEYTRIMLRATRFHADCETCAGGRQGLARMGSALKQEVMDARAAGDEDVEDIERTERLLRDVYSRWQDASKRDKQAKAEENERRRVRYAGKKTVEPEVCNETMPSRRPETQMPGETQLHFEARRLEAATEAEFRLNRLDIASNPGVEMRPEEMAPREGEDPGDAYTRCEPHHRYRKQQELLAREAAFYKRRAMREAEAAAPQELEPSAWEHPKTGEVRVYLNKVASVMVGLDEDRHYEGRRLSRSEVAPYHEAIRALKPYSTADGELVLTRQPETAVEREVAGKITNYWNKKIGA